MGHIRKNKNALTARVRRITGQMAAVEKALKGDAGCSDILQQVAAVRGAINGLMDELIADHLKEHVAAPDLTPAERTEGAEDLIAIIRRYAK
ncbi:MAG: metal/formaldehyde-sensitive transcriptional repressor [Asticcacaulis sp.]|nr:metal/formaldehyde-sensitive transcriptional repressor [Asticcacaulis sp.]